MEKDNAGKERLTKRCWRYSWGGGVAVALTFLSVQSAAACARDGVPSISINGRLALLNRAQGVINIATWSPFVAPQMIQVNKSTTLAENNSQVAKALPHSVFAHPWRWEFGDHSAPRYGTSVQHIYPKAGTYRVAVYAYYAVYASWQVFDYLTVKVR